MKYQHNHKLLIMCVFFYISLLLNVYLMINYDFCYLVKDWINKKWHRKIKYMLKFFKFEIILFCEMQNVERSVHTYEIQFKVDHFLLFFSFMSTVCTYFSFVRNFTSAIAQFLKNVCIGEYILCTNMWNGYRLMNWKYHCSVWEEFYPMISNTNYLSISEYLTSSD